jgi:hypothetical protein
MICGSSSRTSSAGVLELAAFPLAIESDTSHRETGISQDSLHSVLLYVTYLYVPPMVPDLCGGYRCCSGVPPAERMKLVLTFAQFYTNVI